MNDDQKSLIVGVICLIVFLSSLATGVTIMFEMAHDREMEFREAGYIQVYQQNSWQWIKEGK